MAKNYEVKKVAPTVYLDTVGNAVNGFKVTVYLPEFDETQFINVASTDPKLVSQAAGKLVADRRAMADLGDEVIND